MAKRENFYRRNPGDALAGMVGMTLEERGVYNTLIDLLYLTWRPLEDNRAYLAGHCGCAVQKLNPIIDRLIAKRKILRFDEGGDFYLSNQRFEDERSDVKGASKTRSGRAGVGEKSGEVGEKSAGVGQNIGLLGGHSEENQGIIPLDKTREEKIRDAEATAPAVSNDFLTDPDALAWQMVRNVLSERSSLSADQTGKFFGRLLSVNGLAARDMLPAVSAATVNGTQDPRSYLTKAAEQIAKRRVGEKPKAVGFV